MQNTISRSCVKVFLEVWQFHVVCVTVITYSLNSLIILDSVFVALSAPFHVERRRTQRHISVKMCAFLLLLNDNHIQQVT